MSINPVEQVLKTIRNYDMLQRGETVLVAVSGGPDSVFLLHALTSLKSKLGIKKLSVCNLDHGLRGAESRRDSVFVKKLCRENGIKLIYKRCGLKKRSSKTLSTEEAAREARYGFFRAAAAKSASGAVATGHTLDDQAETVLMRLVKGASGKGIAGIPPVRPEGNIKFIRPLIDLEKPEIESYLKRNHIPYCVDSTNAEPVYFRNIVRAEIIPFLEKYNPRLKRSISNLAGHLREDFEFIREAKRKTPGYRVRGEGNGDIVEIKLSDIVIQPRALQKEILRDALEKAGGEVKRLSFRHWKDIENLLRYKRKGSSVDLPGSIRATRSASLLTFRRI